MSRPRVRGNNVRFPVFYSDESAAGYDVSKDEAHKLVRQERSATYIDNGHAIKLLTVKAELKTEIESVLGWNVEPWMRHCALNRGRVGQFSIGYPIPYAFEGHITMPKAAIINAGDKTNSEQLRSCLSST
jgi:hypothetical protein